MIKVYDLLKVLDHFIRSLYEAGALRLGCTQSNKACPLKLSKVTLLTASSKGAHRCLSGKSQ